MTHAHHVSLAAELDATRAWEEFDDTIVEIDRGIGTLPEAVDPGSDAEEDPDRPPTGGDLTGGVARRG